VRGDIEKPSDISGVLYKEVPPGGSIQAIALELVAELSNVGYTVDAGKLWKQT
jgi:hypothetical protein